MAVFPVQLVDFIQPPPLGHVHLAADDGLDAPLFGGLVKVDDAVHTAVVGDGHGLLAQLLHPVQQLLDAAGPVQEAVFGMHVQVYKAHPCSLLSV